MNGVWGVVTAIAAGWLLLSVPIFVALCIVAHRGKLQDERRDAAALQYMHEQIEAHLVAAAQEAGR